MSRVADDSNVTGDWDKSKTSWNSRIRESGEGKGAQESMKIQAV